MVLDGRLLNSDAAYFPESGARVVAWPADLHLRSCHCALALLFEEFVDVIDLGL